MKITKEGVVLALKNIGVFVASYTVADVKLENFWFALLIYALIAVPSDLYMLNRIQHKEANKK